MKNRDHNGHIPMFDMKSIIPKIILDICYRYNTPVDSDLVKEAISSYGVELVGMDERNFHLFKCTNNCSKFFGHTVKIRQSIS